MSALLTTEFLARPDAPADRVDATDDPVLQAARAALNEQSRRVNSLVIALQQCEKQIEELRLQLLIQGANTKAAREAYEAERHARERAEEGAKADREQLESAYASQLQVIQTELDAARAAMTAMRRQRETEASEQATLIAALKTVQRACAVVDAKEDTRAVLVPAEEHPATARTHNVIPHAVHRSLKLVPSSEEQPSSIAPAHLMSYLKELFEQIGAMHSMDSKEGDAASALERLSVNLRCARNMFLQRAHHEGVIGAELFEQELVERLDQLDATTLGRHLAIAAHELEQALTPPARAEAS
jgi:hypothetical protein